MRRTLSIAASVLLYVPAPLVAQGPSGFDTYVALGQPGPNRLRVVDPGSGRTSNAVVVNIS